MERIERFTRDEFEAALPTHKETGDALWRGHGLENGEYTYSIKVRDGVFIKIRSSIREDGRAAATGKDSIRAWLEDTHGKPLGHKAVAFTTRLPGWQDRMTKVLRELWNRALTAGDCATCGKPRKIWKVKNGGKNHGRIFTKCPDHGHFEWMIKENGTYRLAGNERAAEARAEAPKIELTTTEEMVEAVRDIGTIKGRTDEIKRRILLGPGTAVWALLFIYEFQTADEKLHEHTRWHNAVGFSAFDAELLCSFAKQWEDRATLTRNQIKWVYKKMVRYAGQIERHLRPKLEGTE
jgi:hypothetical protein